MKKFSVMLAGVAAALGLGSGKSQMAAPSPLLIKPGPQTMRPILRTQKRRVRDYKGGVKGAFGGPKKAAARLAFIAESCRQANEIAKKRRHDYVQRRTARWRKVVEQNMPAMLDRELRRMGVAI